MNFNEWIRESPQRAGTLAVYLAFTGGIVGALVELPFASLLVFALVLLGEVAVFYFYPRYRRGYC